MGGFVRKIKNVIFLLGFILASCNMSGSTDDVSTSSVTETVSDPQLIVGLSVSETTYVSIVCDTDGASIYYTVDGSTPSISSIAYIDGDQVTITSDSTVVKAIATKTSMNNSGVAEQSVDVLTVTESSLFTLSESGDTITDCDEDLTDVVIPSSVTAIGDYAFYYCSSLTTVIIPDSVISIGDYAFSHCTSLTSIIIPDSVTSIGERAFDNCSSLSSIIISDSLTSIENYTFSYCSSLSSINIPDSVTSFGGLVFTYCSSLSTIVIPDSVTSIGNNAFSYCTSLTSITIPDSITSFGTFLLENCSSLSEITVYFLIPPDIASSTFFDIPSDCILKVPVDCVDVYEASSDWSDFSGRIFEIGS